MARMGQFVRPSSFTGSESPELEVVAVVLSHIGPLRCVLNPLMLRGMKDPHSPDAAGSTGPEIFRLRTLAYFPAAFLLFTALAFCAPAVDGRAIAIPVVLGLLVITAGLALLAFMSRLVTDDGRIDIRFFGLRSRAIRWDEVVAATFGMSFPSLAFGIWLADPGGRRVRLHFGYWNDEDRLLSVVAPRLLQVGPDMDAGTAEILGRMTHTKPRPATLRRVPWLERRTGRPARGGESNWSTRVIAIIGYVTLLIIGVGGMVQRGASSVAAAVAFGVGVAVSLLYPWDEHRPAWVAVSVAVIAALPLAIYLAVGAAAAGYLLGLFGGLIVVRILLKR